MTYNKGKVPCCRRRTLQYCRRRTMSDNSENRITETVLKSFANTPNPRLHLLMTSLVTHLHAFIRDVEPTEAEWFAAIDFLTRTGKMCDDQRQEFILLSDTLGV